MQITRSHILSMPVAVLLFLLPGCRTGSNSGGASTSPAPALNSKQSAEASARRVEAQARYATGLSLDLTQQPDLAIEEYILSLKAEPSNEQLAVEVSRRLFLAKQLERALEVAQIAASSKDASATVYAQLGMLYGELDRYDESIQANRKAMEMAPQSIISYYNLFALHLKQDETEKAIAVLDEASLQNSDSAEFWLDLAEVYATFYRSHPGQKDLVQAKMKECLVQADEKGFTSRSRRLKLADGYALAGNSSRAVELLLELLEDYKDNPNRLNAVRQKLLAIYIRTDDADGALAQLESIVYEHPTNPQANYLLASFAMEKQDERKAIEYFQKTIQLDARFEQAYYPLAGLLLDGRRTEEAISLLETARQSFERNFIIEFYSALAYGELNAHEAAVEHYTSAEIVGKATRPGTLDHRFYFGYGAQQERLKLFDQAAISFQKALDLKSDFAPALNYLGYMWVDQGIHLTRAKEYIEKAVEIDPENSAYLDSLAWAFYKLDQPNLALVHMEDAIKFHVGEEPDAVLYDHLADILLAAGNVEKAREAWEKALEIADDQAVKEKLDELLESNPGLGE